ncbi:hypothetical protein C0992_009886 [Termitomyces sp. T32_za158]|nr:hypothetical protein C0992_009886 [Termitomyces sp. T32_za158]
MAPKGGNAKKESGRAKKAENEANKKAKDTADKERKEADQWKEGAKSAKASKVEKEEKRQADLARKAENARLLAEEEAAAPSKAKSAPKAGKSKPTPKPAGPGAIAAGGGLGAASSAQDNVPEEKKEIESYAATGIDNALDLLEVVNAKMDKASIGQQAAGIERHPEVCSMDRMIVSTFGLIYTNLQRRFKAAFEAYQERELPKAKIEVRYLSLHNSGHEIADIMTSCPASGPTVATVQGLTFNQTTIAYDATKQEKVKALGEKRAQVEQRLKE